MMNPRRSFILLIILATVFGFSNLAHAAKSDKANPIHASVNTFPGQFAFVQGDFEKFQAHHWMKEDYVGGVKDAHVTYGESDPEKIFMEGDGHAIVGNGDYGGSYLIEQKDAWALRFHYDEFRKYYDGTGGVYHRFVKFSGIDLDRELALDIGKFEVELEITPEELPDITFVYEHEFREGSKSRLTWASVTEGAVTRNIAPSWQEIDEQVDIFAVKIEDEIKGFTVRGEQSVELARIESRRYERSYTTNEGTTAALLNQRRVRVHDQDPRTDLFTTTLGMERWFWENKAHGSAAYRFSHLDNSERENLREFDFMMNPRCLSANCENKLDARADNTADINTLVLSGAVFPWPALNITTRIKAEMMNRQGESRYPSDIQTVGAAPVPSDNDPNRIEFSNIVNRVRKIGEGISVRYKGIPRSAFYTEFEGEQLFNTITEDRTSRGLSVAASAGEIFSRETETPSWRGVWTAGVNASPFQFINFTNQFRYRKDNNSYHDERESLGSSSQARSAFFEELDIRSVEINSRATLKPCRWFQTAFRHQVRDINYVTRIEDQSPMEPQSLSNIFSYDVTLFPIPQISIMGSMIQENFYVESDKATFMSPTFTGDVDTWLLAIAYALRENLSLDSSVSYTRANNFNDFTDIGLPLGADFNRIEAAFGVMWKPKEDVSIGPKYAFYHYGSNHKAEIGDYNVNVAGLEASLAWG